MSFPSAVRALDGLKGSTGTAGAARPTLSVRSFLPDACPPATATHTPANTTTVPSFSLWVTVFILPHISTLDNALLKPDLHQAKKSCLCSMFHSFFRSFVL